MPKRYAFATDLPDGIQNLELPLVVIDRKNVLPDVCRRSRLMETSGQGRLSQHRPNDCTFWCKKTFSKSFFENGFERQRLRCDPESDPGPAPGAASEGLPTE